MKKFNYLQYLNQTRSTPKFNMIYESIMTDLEIYKGTKPGIITNYQLNLILEEIEKPQYVICESSGKKILLEEAMFLPEDYLISEGILEKVGQKIQKIIDWIKEGIKKVLSAASDMIKAFCEKVKNNAVIAAIRKKLGLDSKLKSENFKQFVKVTAQGKDVAVESVQIVNGKCIITEATKLNKKEEAITDPKELEPLIKKWEDALSGKKVINNAKTGKPLSRKYCQDKLRLLKRKMASLQQSGNDAKDLKLSNDTEKAENTNITVDNNKSSEKSKSEKKPLGDIHFNIEGMKGVVVTVKDESLSEEKINAAAEEGAVAAGGSEAEKVITGDSNPPDDKNNNDKKEDGESEGDGEDEFADFQPKKKKGFFGKLNDKINAAGNKLKEKIKSGVSKAKNWFNSQNKVVKILICCVIAVLAILGIYFLITAVIYPILYGILHGGIVNAAIGIFRLYASGKTFIATYKAGKKSWESGEGWAKTFLMIGLSLLAIVNLGQMAAQGNAMMAADQAKNAAAQGSSAGAESTAEGGAEAADGAASTAGAGGPYDLEANGIIKGGTITGPDGTAWTVEDLGDTGYAKAIDAVKVSTKLPNGTTVENYIPWKDIHKGPARVEQLFKAFGAGKDIDVADGISRAGKAFDF